MNEKKQNKVLETAWLRYAQLDANAITAKKRYMRLKRVMVVLTVLAVLFAILVNNYNEKVPTWSQLILKALLIITPIITSVIAAFANKFQQGQRYLASRAAAEEILNNIYFYRTVWKESPLRNKKLSEQLAKIQRQLFRRVGGELFLKQYRGDLPPYYDSTRDYSDPGYHDLSGAEYIAYRLEDQLAWHIKENLKLQRNRKRMQWLILIFGGAGAFLAAWGGALVVWVALTATIASALMGWEELRGLDMKVTNYSVVILELNIIYDHWQMLDEDERAEEEVNKIVYATENVLWNQNADFVNAMQKALAESEGEEELMMNVLEKEHEVAEQIQKKLYTETEEFIGEGIDEAKSRIEESIEVATNETLQQIYTDMQTIKEEEVARAEAEEKEVVPEDFVDEYFGDDNLEKDFIDEDFVDEDFTTQPEIKEEFVNETLIDAEDDDKR